MASKDDQRKVRPIEFEPDDRSASAESLERNEPSAGSRRPLLALAFSAVAVLIAVGAVSVFGALEFSDLQPWTQEDFSATSNSDPESPSDSLPPRLEDSLPYVTDRLTLIAVAEDRLETLLWDPSYRVPRTYEMPIEGIERTTHVDATFDSGGRTLAINLTTPSGSQVYVGQPTDMGAEPDLIGAISVIWHTSDIGAIAWTTPIQDGGSELHTGKVHPLSGSIDNDVTVARFDTMARLVHWDSAGFVVDRGSSASALTSEGREIWSRAGIPVSASTSIVTVIATDHRAGDTHWLAVDRESGDPSSETVDGSPKDTWVVTSRDTDIIAEVSSSDDRTTILVHGPDLGPRRIVTVPMPAAPIGFSATSEYLQLSSLDSNEIIFANWRTGIVHIVAVPEEFQVIGLDLG